MKMLIYKFAVLGLGAVTLLSSAGCDATRPEKGLSFSGFLSDYSRLESFSKTSYRYVNPKHGLDRYSRFIVEPVEILLDDVTRSDIDSWDELERLRAYMRRTLIDTLEPRYAAFAQTPGQGVVIIRVALSGIRKPTMFKPGGATVEAELLDSVTGEQIAAIVERGQKKLPFGGYAEWDEARAVMDDWAKRFYDRLEEARGY